MWLINVDTYELEEFLECPSGKYAILSHCWEVGGELNFDEFRTGAGRTKAGFYKIQKCCEQAKSDRLQYTWVDTVCIDKRSSAELSETINSMYQWYREAKECYVFMKGVKAECAHTLSYCSQRNTTSSQRHGTKTMFARCLTPLVTHLGDGELNGCIQTRDSFESNRWFKRGWTLQELVAPSLISFFSEDWTFIGSKAQLAHTISKISGIDVAALTFERAIDSYSVAQRMSWASERSTTRKEDIAYCLLGIFDVNMPLLYGEGEKAFYRLQEVIIASNDDESIFAWTELPPQYQHTKSSSRQSKVIVSGLLAWSPRAFLVSRHIIKISPDNERPPYSMTNKGLMITGSLLPENRLVQVLPLNCASECSFKFTYSGVMGLFIRRVPDEHCYRRVHFRGRNLIRLMTHTTGNDNQNVYAPCGTCPSSLRPLLVKNEVHNDNGSKGKLFKSNFWGYEVLKMQLGFQFSHLMFMRIGGNNDSNSSFASKPNTKRKGDVGCLISNAEVRNTLDTVQCVIQPETMHAGIDFEPTVSTFGLIRVKLGFDREYAPVCFVWSVADGGIVKQEHRETAKAQSTRINCFLFDFCLPFPTLDADLTKIKFAAFHGDRVHGIEGNYSLCSPSSWHHGYLRIIIKPRKDLDCLWTLSLTKHHGSIDDTQPALVKVKDADAMSFGSVG